MIFQYSGTSRTMMLTILQVQYFFRLLFRWAAHAGVRAGRPRALHARDILLYDAHDFGSIVCLEGCRAVS